ncbi:MAG: thioredoxin-dependent thiol peroxidase [Anaerolineae bacterium]|jgi:peroxiredoxin Q/BCP|nr:thioredoxin-dependent thiol peroxidase [Chloroflexota bacterium]
MLTENTMAPEFTLESDQGESVSLSDFRGKKVVLYFYPKDNTSGCTKEACAFRDENAAIANKGAVVIGVSPDSLKSHANFREKYQLPFYLLSDPTHEVATAFGAWGEKIVCGKTTTGMTRSTFIIDEEGKIIKVFPKVKVDGHVAQVLAAL